MAGYSGTPLPQKLGIKPGHRVALLDAPAGFARVLGKLPDSVTISNALAGKQPYDVMVLFVMAERDLVRRLAPAQKRLEPSGGLWIAWPKRASGIATDVTETSVRGALLATGLVDNKVCAIDETWSGLRGVVRLVDRPPKLAAKRPKTVRRALRKRAS